MLSVGPSCCTTDMRRRRRGDDDDRNRRETREERRERETREERRGTPSRERQTHQTHLIPLQQLLTTLICAHGDAIIDLLCRQVVDSEIQITHHDDVTVRVCV